MKVKSDQEIIENLREELALLKYETFVQIRSKRSKEEVANDIIRELNIKKKGFTLHTSISHQNMLHLERAVEKIKGINWKKEFLNKEGSDIYKFINSKTENGKANLKVCKR